jgi:hypothetical protein
MKIMREEINRHNQELQKLEELRKSYEQKNLEHMKKIQDEYEVKRLKYVEIYKEECRKRNLNYQAYLEQMKKIDISIKEKEEQTKKEIEIYRQKTEEAIRQIKEKAKLKLQQLDEKNKRELEELERQFQNLIFQNSDFINRLLIGYQNEVNRANFNFNLNP